MNPFVEALNYYLAAGGVGALLGAVILIVDAHREQALATHIRKFGIVVALVIAFGSTLMALVYSEKFGFVPCGLCWLERIFLFPQVILLGTALYFKDALIARYGLVLSVLGALVGLYHHYLQMGGAEFVPCPVTVSASCAERILFEFGFMTFPLLAVSGFALLGALYYYMLKLRY